MDDYKANLLGDVETILLSTDGSDYGEGAIQEAIFLAQACSAKLVILNVIHIGSSSAINEHAVTADARRSVAPHIQRIEKMAEDSEIDFTSVYEEGFDVDDIIVKQAVKHKADVIIMGRHGKRGLLELLVGSMTSKVINRGFPKVLVVPKDVTISGETLVLATDGSEQSQLAAKETLSLSEKCTQLKNIVVVSVATTDSDIAKAEANVNEVVAAAKDKGIKLDYKTVVEVGKPSEIVIDTARNNNADLVIVGGFGEGLSKKLMGHTTEKIIGNGNCAVLVVCKGG